MTIKEVKNNIKYARQANAYLSEKQQKLIPIDVYSEVLEYVRIGVPSLIGAAKGIKVRERTLDSKEYSVGDFAYTDELVIVPISRDKEAVFNRI